ncbi:AAA family ATPase [Candidatus Poribacteria bacterium]|nr:AAA family ATPase [Candidatus Poribacteria bacterium]
MPFSLTPDPAFLYYSSVHRRAIAFLKYGLQESKGFLQLTGPIGSGKTTLLRAVLSHLDEKTKTAYIINPCAPFPDLLRSIMKDLEIPNIPQTRLKIELLDFFHDYLLVQTRRSQRVVVIFDEAQNLSIKNLEEIRMLSNFETTKEKLLQIVFVGQPELKKTLDAPELRQLKQRIQVRYHLAPLNQGEVKEYIDHRLRVAGSDGSVVFSDEACREIHEFSGGIPRLINSVCDVMLLIGYVNERKTFDGSQVTEAIDEMNGSPREDSLTEEANEKIVGNRGVECEPEDRAWQRIQEEAGPADDPVTRDICGKSEDKFLQYPEQVTEETEEVPESDNTDSAQAAVTVSEPDSGFSDPAMESRLPHIVVDEMPQPTEGGEASPAVESVSGERTSRRLELLQRTSSRIRSLLQRRFFASVRRIDLSQTLADKRKIAVLLDNGRIVNGYTRELLDVNKRGFDFIPCERTNGHVEGFVPFDRIIAARFLESFDGVWEEKRHTKHNSPKGREIIVTLKNGMVVEGITLGRFNARCDRFFVISTNGDEKASWLLIERTGTLGILAETFKDGIYAEEFENLPPLPDDEERRPEPVSDYETAGDRFFAVQNYDSALLQYQEALETADGRKRLNLKLSLCYYNRGLAHIRAHRFLEAKMDFEKVAGSPYLRGKARARMREIGKLTKT